MSEKKQQTAVEWLAEKLIAEYGNFPDAIVKLFEQAKEMEEEQHEETFKQSRLAKIFEKDMPPVWESCEQYYYKTYGK